MPDRLPWPDWVQQPDNAPAHVDSLLGLASIVPWYERMTGLGHGTPSELGAEAALGIAKYAMPAPVSPIAPDTDPSGLRRGSAVTVTPDDNAKVPVTGTLIAAEAEEIILHSNDRQAGDLHLHVPGAGFEMSAA